MKKYYVYVMTNRTRTLYVGVTGDLERRILEHKQKLVPGFTSKYNITELVWFQDFDDVQQAIEAEKRIKAWRRSKKIALVEEANPQWLDLAEALNPVTSRSFETSGPNPVTSRSAETSGRGTDNS
jgi:putative endonuclease